jgi:hypothetical protein
MGKRKKNPIQQALGRADIGESRAVVLAAQEMAGHQQAERGVQGLKRGDAALYCSPFMPGPANT